jgi:hypothetical protein
MKESDGRGKELIFVLSCFTYLVPVTHFSHKALSSRIAVHRYHYYYGTANREGFQHTLWAKVQFVRVKSG